MYYDYIKCELNVFDDEPKCDLWTYLTHARNNLRMFLNLLVICNLILKLFFLIVYINFKSFLIKSLNLGTKFI
jgi:hypothetical protein